MKSALIFLCFFFFSSPLMVSTHFSEIIVWNVGQGQWITITKPSICIHIDMGGEKINWQKVKLICGGKKNYLSITHGDWDHVSFIGRSKRVLGSLNQNHSPEGLKLLFDPKMSRPTPFNRKKHQWRKLKPNDLSKVFIYNNSLLAPGDSTKKMEKIWRRLIIGLPIKWLVLGHHGSNTSTSKYLLKYLDPVKLAIVSARKKRYGHPHSKVQSRLREKGIPLIRTELWGNIRIEF